MSNYLLSHTGAQIDAALKRSRNLVDNADFQIWTRGTSVTVADGGSQCCADRYRIANSSGVPATMTKGAMQVDGVARTCGMVSLSAAVATYTSDKRIVPFMQAFEGRSVYRYLSPGKSFVVAVAIEVSVAGKYAFAVRNADASFSFVHSEVLTANTPTTVSFIVPIPTTGGLWNCPNTVEGGLNMLIGAVGAGQYAAPSTDRWISGSYITTADCVNWTATAGATVKITRVRLEEGTSLGAHQAKSYDEDAARCAYFLPSIPVGVIGICSWWSATRGGLPYPFKTPARWTPNGLFVPPGLTLYTTSFGASRLDWNDATSDQVGSIQVTGSGASPGGSSLIYTTGTGSIIFTGAELL